MNDRPLNREELQKRFDYFADVPNKNEITILGAYVKRKDELLGIGKTKYNPNYKFLHKYGEHGETIQTIPTVKVVVKIPSDTRIGSDGQPFTTNIPLFCTDKGVDAVKAIDAFERPIQYVACRGAVQNFAVTRHASPSAPMLVYLRKWMDMYCGQYDEVKAARILHILRMSLDVNDGVQIPMLNVWIHEIADGTDMAESLKAAGQRVGVNEASISGLVYMPPSYHARPDGKSGRLHLKVRVKRNDFEGQTVPTAQQSQDGYDIINVVYEGEKAEEYFSQLKQGYPILVNGSLENYKFVRRATVNFIEQKELAEYLGVELRDRSVQDIVQFVNDSDIKETLPSYNILAKEIRTDYQNW